MAGPGGPTSPTGGVQPSKSTLARHAAAARALRLHPVLQTIAAASAFRGVFCPVLEPMRGGEGGHAHSLVPHARDNDEPPVAGNAACSGLRAALLEEMMRAGESMRPLRHGGVVLRQIIGARFGIP